MTESKQATALHQEAHGILVSHAEKWLWRQSCILVATEFTAAIHETPDAIGWASGGKSILVECKTSISDFKKDQLKLVRQYQAFGIGRRRYYFTIKGLLEGIEIPDPWGLLEWSNDRVYTKKKAKLFNHNVYAEVQFLLSAIRRFDQQHLEGVSVKAYPLQSPNEIQSSAWLCA